MNIDANLTLADAATRGDVKAVEEALHNGASVNSVVHRGWPALMHAAKHGHVPCVEALINAKAHINRKNDNGWTALHVAAYFGHDECVVRLIAAGAKVDEKNNDGMTSLALAIQKKNRKTSEMLMDAGAELANVDKGVPHWAWVYPRRRNVKRSLVVFIGLLRRRLVTSSAAAAPDNRIPRDMVNKLALHVWERRVDPQWDWHLPDANSEKKGCCLQ